MADPMILRRALAWPARHFLVTWAMIFVVVTVAAELGVRSSLTWTIWFLAFAPFAFVVPFVEQLFQPYEDVVDIVAAAVVVCIYIGLDVALWAVIRSSRRGIALRQRGDNERTTIGLRDGIDLVSAWIVRHAFPLWGLTVGVLQFFAIGLDTGGIGFYQPNLRGAVLYGGALLSLPVLPLFSIVESAGVNLKDPASRAVVMTVFVILCVILDILIKQHLRKSVRDRASPPTSEH